MSTVNFLLKTNTNPSKIYIRFKNGRDCDLQTTTNFIINPNDWSQAKQKPKNLKNVDFKNLDTDLQNLKTNLLQHFNNSTETINLTWLKNFINPKSKSDAPEELVLYFDYYLKLRKNELTLATNKKINVVKNKLILIQKQTKKIYKVKDVNLLFKKEFEDWNKSKGYADNTISENLKEIKTICRHAGKHGIAISNLLSDISTTQTKAISIYLTFEEIDKIETAELEFDYLQNARDWLLISCYTAQRVSDFMRFNKEMIRVQDGNKLIEFTQLKTGKIMTLPLHPKVLEVLNKRNGDFPHEISSQKYNDYIKKVCEIAKIEEMVYGGKMEKNRKVLKEYKKHELVTSHIGRRSFATNFYGKIPTALLMNATGHSTEAMFLIYIGKSSTDKAIELSKYF
jgi:integrase